MHSEPKQAYVWIWLAGSAEPVVAGRLDPVGPNVNFTYARSYLERENAISLYTPELPLERKVIPPRSGEIAGCIADAAPDAWGQRVILNHLVGREALETTELGILTYLLESGSDRIGALDFQPSANEYVARSKGEAELEELNELARSAEKVEQGEPLSEALDLALLHGTSVGGARPKALLRDRDRGLIAKFSSTTDKFAVVKGEFVAMELARRAGLDVAKVKLTRALGKDALLIERFDRVPTGRRALVSALTILGLDEHSGSYASYAELADRIRADFSDPIETVRELFGRIVFNILCGNTDDHARNHAAFWDGDELTLTPAYDISPLPRAGGEASQAMAIGPNGFRLSQLSGALSNSSTYRLAEDEAREIIDHQIDVIRAEWDEVCELGELTEIDRNTFRQGSFLKDFALEGYRQRD